MSAVLKPYCEFRPIGLAWLEQCPSHWATVRPKAIFRRMQRPVRREDDVVTCFRDGVVTLRKNRRTTGFTEALQEIGYQGIRKGDLVIHAMDAFAGAIGVSDSDGKGTPVYAVCRPSAQANAHYYASILREMSRSEYLLSLAKGIRERSTDFRYNDFACLEVPLPPPDEQEQIVRFVRHLDHRVNRLVKAKRRLIELLNEQKQAIIHRAVTRGLDPTAPLKPSGIEWLGEIPKHWQAKPFKYFFREVDERSTTGDEEILSVSHLTGVTPRSQKNITMFMAVSYVGHKKCQPGDLVANTMWLWMGALGVSKHEGILSPSYAVYRPRTVAPLESAYLDMLLRTRLYVDEYTKNSKGIRPSRLRLYPDQFLKMAVLQPPLDEQRRICEHLALATQEIVGAMTRTASEIDLIREYRTRLVADVVTGQLDVRHLDMPEIEDSLLAVADAPGPADDEEPDEIDQVESGD